MRFRPLAFLKLSEQEKSSYSHSLGMPGLNKLKGEGKYNAYKVKDMPSVASFQFAWKTSQSASVVRFGCSTLYKTRAWFTHARDW